MQLAYDLHCISLLWCLNARGSKPGVLSGRWEDDFCCLFSTGQVCHTIQSGFVIGSCSFLGFHNCLTLESTVTKIINFFMERSCVRCPEPLATN